MGGRPAIFSKSPSLFFTQDQWDLEIFPIYLAEVREERMSNQTTCPFWTHDVIMAQNIENAEFT